MSEPSRIAPVEELVNAFEFEAMARRRVDGVKYAEIFGGDRKAFDRITFRPRMMVNTTKLNLTAELFGQPMFAPILIGPISQQKRFHPDGELAMARGASAAKAVMVISSDSSHPIGEIAGLVKTGFWYQVYPESDVNGVRSRVEQAVTSGCKAVCLTLGADVIWDWNAIDRFRKGISVPFVLKGIMSPEEARTAVERGVDGIVVSSYGEHSPGGMAAPIEMLPEIADAVAGKAPILVDGGFRSGGDVLKAIALGARAALVARPPLWGLAAYGAPGVQAIVELLQTELARDMAMCGKVDLKAVDRSVVKVHRW